MQYICSVLIAIEGKWKKHSDIKIFWYEKLFLQKYLLSMDYILKFIIEWEICGQGKNHYSETPQLK